MFSKIRKRLTYANVAMTLALVFAMSGGAYAAKHYLITSTKQISPKVLKALKGNTGPAGAAGLAGAQGGQGLKGETGAAGASVTGKEGPEGKEGKEGEKGKEGSPWTVNGTLPSGKTEKGDWTVSGQAQGGLFEGFLVGAVSFDIPLAVAPAAVHLIPAPTLVEEEKGEFPKPPTGCTGNFTNPGAAGGSLCVFAREEFNLYARGKICPAGSQAVFLSKHDTVLECATSGAGIPEEADPYGFIVFAEAKEKGYGLAMYGGTWAVTAE
jgi:hypothetical protein